jgi:hypothetical protein
VSAVGVAPQPLAALPTLPPPEKLETFRSTSIPGGLACLIRLKELGIPHVSLPPQRGVLTPVRITGAINGIAYHAMARLPLVCDCRLALALHRAAPYLLQMGVEELHYSSAYSYRLMPSGRLSQHAMGLAIDVHRVKIKGQLYDVQEDFVLGRENNCAADGPPLNRMGCLLRAWGLFDWVLTPDFDRAHRNHFHLDIYCLHRRRYPQKPAPAEVVFD